MRTTITLDDDVLAAIRRRRREQSVGLSEAVNELIREALLATKPRQRYIHRSRNLGLRIDVSDIADALEIVEGQSAE